MNARQFQSASPAERAELCEFVDRVLRESDDLPSFIRPTAGRLLTTWEERQADLLTVAVHSTPPHSMSQRNTIAVAAVTWSAEECCLTIEYLGVGSQFRRLGIGRLLLRQLEARSWSLQRQSAVTRSLAVTVAAFVDTANVAAVALYEFAGYVPDSDYQLWHMPANVGLR